MNRPPVFPALAVRALACRRGERLLFRDLSFALDARAVESFQRLADEHLQAGGMILAASHLDLGLGAARALTLTDFAPAREEL